jgi:hypothetical protein
MQKISACLIATTAAFVLSWTSTPAAQPQRNPGVSTVCGTFTPDLLILLSPTLSLIVNLNDEAWAYVDPQRKIRTATGVAENVHVAAIDSFSNHDSHDLDFELRLDPEPNQNDLLSIQDEYAMGIEWETGIRPSETKGDGVTPTLPKWVWPSDGDRVWAEGNWIFDCGHPDEDTGLYKTEIHPPRAMASMRDQAGPLPGTGLTPVPITMTDLYISGRGGFTPNQLNCGPHITLGFNGSTCGQDPPPADDSYRTTPINDTDFTFTVCLPPRPAGAAFSHSVEVGPRNTVNIEPEIDDVPATGACQTSPEFDNTTMMRVTVKLQNTATPPQSVYARHIAAGWVTPPTEPLPHRRLSVRSTNLFEDHDTDPEDGELSFWWVNVNRAASPWLRLADHTNGDMNDYDDETGFGDGEMSFTTANFDFYLRKDQPFTLRSRGYEQDCYDTIGAFGSHYFNLLVYVACNLDVLNHGASDDIAAAEADFDSDFASASHTVHGGSDYDMRVMVEHLPLGLEDTSYLSTAISCGTAGEVALVGQPLVCSTRADNGGPGLPRSVSLKTSFDAGPPTATVSAAAWSVLGPLHTGPHGCEVTGSNATCHDVVVPVAATPTIATITASPLAPGILTARANVSTASADPDLTNNSASTTVDVFQPITIDVAPRDNLNVLNLKRGGIVDVAILTTDALDASAVDATSVCFGDAEAPAERTCVEVHGRGHLDDVNRDRRLDLVLHFDLSRTGIDLVDTKACLIARTTSGTGVYACEVISPK